MVLTANNCISVLLTQLGVEALSCADTLLPYISMQAFYNRLSSRHFLLAFFNLVHKVGGVVRWGLVLAWCGCGVAASLVWVWCGVWCGCGVAASLVWVWCGIWCGCGVAASLVWVWCGC